MAERGRGCCGDRGGGRREDPLDDQGLHQRDLRDVKNDDLRRGVRALRRRIARLEASRDGDFNSIVHCEDDDINDNPSVRAGGERRFPHRVADPWPDFRVRLEIPEFNVAPRHQRPTILKKGRGPCLNCYGTSCILA
ncbi:hypothetical protein CASFOL_004421 [Castilleja foliolosa]|uniref:Uncharacterized protein n=1 Tax=Castilleja foliolosa TaxID=1961234 RepID=A0ABD3EB64_9LAMI